MQKNKILAPWEIYAKHLEIVGGVKFTPREIDVISCMLSGKSAKTLSSFLSITPKTIESHMRNIMSKLECNSRDGVINFIEKSDQYPFVKQYYSALLGQTMFEKTLEKLAVLIQNEDNVPSCAIIYWNDDDKNLDPLNHLADYLKLAGIEVTLSAKKSPAYIIDSVKDSPSKKINFFLYVLPLDLMEKISEKASLPSKTENSMENVLFILPEREDQKGFSDSFSDFLCIDLQTQNSYYAFVLNLLTLLFPKLDFQGVVAEFKEELETTQENVKTTFCHVCRTEKKWLSFESYSEYIELLISKKWHLIYGFFIMLTIGIGGFTLLENTDQNVKKTVLVSKQDSGGSQIRSDLILPKESVLLHRSELVARIDEKFKEGEGIQTIALVGVGGAGKTTIARQYARTQKTAIVWEIYAETKSTLKSSFEKLADALAKTEEDQRILKGIENTADSEEREYKIIKFVKNNLKKYDNWILIYDNVENFADVRKYFPQDADTWGRGNVILTTRDGNIQNNGYINDTIFMGELSPDQKLALFEMIVDKGGKDKKYVEDPKIKEFLKSIPPFPLDVSVAAYYLKTTKTPYDVYLKILEENGQDFSHTQEELLQETGTYTKTRYNIITLSLQHLLDFDPHFKELLLLIFLLDSQNLPRDLLYYYKDKILVDKFIKQMKKYSLITTESSESVQSIPVFSIHHSTQALGLTYLTKMMDLEKKNEWSHSLTNALEKYIFAIKKNKDFSRMKIMKAHCKKYLSHSKFLTESAINNMTGELGTLYFHLGDYVKSKALLEEALSNTDLENTPNHSKVAHMMECLGDIHKGLGDCIRAKNLFEKSIVMYQKQKHFKYTDVTRIFALLGSTHIYLGEYERAKDYFENAKDLLEKNYSTSEGSASETLDDVSWVLSYLAILHRDLGQYVEAKKLIEQSIEICSSNPNGNPLIVAFGLAQLGKICGDLGHYKEATALLERSLKIYKNRFFENSTDFAWALGFLGGVYVDSKNYIKAEEALKKSLNIYNQHLPDNHLFVGWAMINLAELYEKIGKYEEAKFLLEKSLHVFETSFKKEHLDTARIFLNLGKIHFAENKFERGENLVNNALSMLEKKRLFERYMCLETLSDNYLKRSKHGCTPQDCNDFKNKAVSYLKKALVVVKEHAPKDSPHITRLYSKLETLQKNLGPMAELPDSRNFSPILR